MLVLMKDNVGRSTSDYMWAKCLMNVNAHEQKSVLAVNA